MPKNVVIATGLHGFKSGSDTIVEAKSTKLLNGTSVFKDGVLLSRVESTQLHCNYICVKKLNVSVTSL